MTPGRSLLSLALTAAVLGASPVTAEITTHLGDWQTLQLPAGNYDYIWAVCPDGQAISGGWQFEHLDNGYNNYVGIGAVFEMVEGNRWQVIIHNGSGRATRVTAQAQVVCSTG